MENLLIAIFTQSLTFLPLALGISTSFLLLQATDMTLDGSFVLGAGIFAHLVTVGVPPSIACMLALMSGAAAGLMVSLIQRKGQIDSLLAGILAAFILSSANLILMGRPNINLLNEPTLFSAAFTHSNLMGWSAVALCSGALCLGGVGLLSTSFGLTLRALGSNPTLLNRLSGSIEHYRMLGFMFTNALAAAAGFLTAQTVGYADINMGFGMTLTGIGAIILGNHFIRFFVSRPTHRVFIEFMACLTGVLFYFFAINLLLRGGIDPTYLKMILGLILIIFLRSTVRKTSSPV